MFPVQVSATPTYHALLAINSGVAYYNTTTLRQSCHGPLWMRGVREAWWENMPDLGLTGNTGTAFHLVEYGQGRSNGTYLYTCFVGSWYCDLWVVQSRNCCRQISWMVRWLGKPGLAWVFAVRVPPFPPNWQPDTQLRMSILRQLDDAWITRILLCPIAWRPGH